MTVFRHIFCFLIFIAATVLCPRQSDAAIVQNIRLGDQSGSSVRIVVDLSEKTDFKIFPLSNPDRVVIDLPKTSFDIKESALPKKDYLNKRSADGTNRIGIQSRRRH